MNSIKFKSEEVNLKGQAPQLGDKAEDFTYVKEDLSEENFYKLKDKVKLLIAVPSIDTSVCQKEVKRFSEELKQYKDAVGIIISKDLPFAMKRFISGEGIENVIMASDFRYDDFSNEYNLEIINGPLKGLLARVVYVVDQENKISYSQFVEEITEEPDYSAALDAAKKLLQN